jgi:hypothetical protein
VTFYEERSEWAQVEIKTRDYKGTYVLNYDLSRTIQFVEFRTNVDEAPEGNVGNE